jgi:flagellar biosynthesis protein
LSEEEERPEASPSSQKAAVAIGSGGAASNVPKVLASGKGDMAQKLLDYAESQGMAIEKNSDLAQVLINLDLGDSVPEEVFMAVAEILYYIYEVNDSLKSESPTS